MAALLQRPRARSKRIFISYRHVEPDESLALFLEQHLSQHSYTVFIDKRIKVGKRWADEIRNEIQRADFFVVLVSEHSVLSDMLRQETKFAHDLERQGRLTILPVRVCFTGELPYDLASYLAPIQYTLWDKAVRMDTVASELLAAIEGRDVLPHEGQAYASVAAAEGLEALYDSTERVGAPLPKADPRLIGPIKSETGAMLPDSPFYVERKADDEALTEVLGNGTTTLIRGPRQFGKSSLLARTLRLARQSGRNTFYMDFQLVDAAQMASLDALLHYVAVLLARELGARSKPADTWDKNLGAKENVRGYITDAILAHAETPVVVALDEVDHVFTKDYRDDFFATIRGWHNLRANDDRWNKLNLIMAHSTEPYLWIRNLDQSPFNVGLRIQLSGFDAEQVSDLNRRYGSPLKDESEIDELIELVGGHPFLVRQSFYVLASHHWSVATLAKEGAGDAGPFGDHLRQFVWRLQERGELRKSLIQILNSESCDDERHFQRLRAAGLVTGDTRQSVRLRCKLYKEYFRRHL